MKRRKTIGIILSQAEEQYQGLLLSGIIERAFELDYDCAVFSVPVKYYASEDIYIGAFNIFNLINFDRLDAVIVVPDTLEHSRMKDGVLALIREKFSGPAVSVDMESDGMPCIESDDAAVIEKITDHLIDCHGFKIIDFMQGIPSHRHSARRLAGYRRSLEKHGIAYDERRVHDGDFWYNKGEDVADEILSSELERPRAVVCASDPMAMSLCDAFMRRGISVPEDIAVTGYDRIPDSRNHIPTVTSADFPAKQTGIRAVGYLHSLMENTAYEETHYEPKINPARSCGCAVDTADEFYNNFAHCSGGTINGSAFFTSENFMMNKLIASENTDELINYINWHTFQIRPYKAFYLCITDDWDSCGEEVSEEHARTGYTDEIHLCISRNENDDGKEQIFDEVFDKSVMIPDLDADREKPAVYYFSPLYFNSHTFGYTVMKYEEPRSLNIEYRSWLNYVSYGFECMRRHLHIQMMYRQIKMTAITDNLTGLYNRNAFNNYIVELTSSAMHNSVKAMFMMADLNYLKTVNDTCGHLGGDKALKAVGEALKNACGENERCYRFGGDEFMIIGVGDYSEERTEEIAERIHSYLDRYNENAELPFTVSVSLGAVCAEINAETDIDKIIKSADEIMYRNKRKTRT